MDEDLAIIEKNTRKEEIKKFFIKHKKKIYFLMHVEERDHQF